MSTHPTYTEQRQAMERSMAAEAPPALLNGFRSAADRLAAIDFAARAPRPGDAAPDFTLPDQSGEPVRLSALLSRGPVVLIFYRGEWCPYCNLQLRTFQAHLPELTRQGAQLVAVSPQTPDHSPSMAERNELGFPVLSDVGAHVIERYGLRYEVDAPTRELLLSAGNDVGIHNGEAGWVLPAAATFVIDAAGEIRFASVSGDWTARAEPAEVLEALAYPSASSM